MVRSGPSRNALTADPSNAAVPGGSRPNYGNPNVGAAVPRGTTGGGGGSGNGGSDGGYGGSGSDGSYHWGSPYTYYGGYGAWRYPYYYYYPYDPFYLYGYGAFGLGFLYYDPFWFGGLGGLGGGGGAGASASAFYGVSPLSGGDAASGGGSGSGWSGVGGWSSSAGSSAPAGVKGGLKLKVTPKDAEVYVDGNFMGRVDEYNGAFQRLQLPVGMHRVELRAKGYDNASFEVKIEPRDTLSYHGTMQALQPAK